MFGFKKVSKAEKLQKQYEKLMQEAFVLSKSNRTLSDSKYAEADQIASQIEDEKGK